jgi:uncharacterized RDD family membrane protein YckC/Tfp pilus assembly major pilin PilA
MSTASAAYTPPIDQPPPATPVPLYGGFWIRFAAHFVDCFIIWVGTSLIAVVLYIAASSVSATGANVLIGLGLLVLGQLYHAYFVSSAKMATPGKRLCGLYVTDKDGHRLGFGRALWRNVAALFSYLTLCIGFLMAGFTSRKQALHDMIAGTVVHRQPGTSAPVAVVIVVAMFLVVVVGGILAAIGVSSFEEYGVKAKISGTIAGMSRAKAPIAAYAAEKGAWPTTWEQVRLDGAGTPLDLVPQASREIVKDIRLEPGGTIVATVRVRQTEGQLRMVPKKVGDSIEWTCTSSPEIRKYAAAPCRN